jgi:hypothetical protein
MAANTLTLNEMVHVTGAMTARPSEARAILERTPFLKPLLVALDAAHERVVSAMPPSDNRVKELSVAAAGLDAVHDALASNLYGYLTNLSGLMNGGPQLLDLRDELLPDGVAGATQVTYEAEAGYAERLAARLTPELSARLAAVPVCSRTLLDLVNEWIEAGQHLGQLEQERREALTELAARPVGAVNQARLEWVRTINAVRGVASMAGLSQSEHRTVFGLLEELEHKGDQRVSRRRQKRQEGAKEGDADEVSPPAAGAEPDLDTSRARDDVPGGNPLAGM